MPGIYKFFFQTHRWVGIVLGVVFATTAVTGFLLVMKKQLAWVQPPTLKGAEGNWQEFISNQELCAAVLAREHPHFQDAADIERVDFQPKKSLFKVQSNQGPTEVQVCAVTGEVLQVATRRSDLIEQIHDGTFFAGWFHDFVMPVAAVSQFLLVFTGLWIWIHPALRRRRAKARSKLRQRTRQEGVL